MNTYIFIDETLTHGMPMVAIKILSLGGAVHAYLNHDKRSLKKLKEVYGECPFNETQLKFIDLYDMLNSGDMHIYEIEEKLMYSTPRDVSEEASKGMLKEVGYNEFLGLEEEDLK